MAIFQAFRALRPVPDKAEAVAALPYDVVTREEAKEIGDQNPDSFLHVDRAEMDLPADTDLYDQKVYDRARENLINMEKNGILVQDGAPSRNMSLLERIRSRTVSIMWMYVMQTQVRSTLPASTHRNFLT